MGQIFQHIQTWDEIAILRIVARRRTSITKFMKFMSLMGDGYLWAVLVVAFYAFSDVTSRWLFVGLAGFAIELIAYKIIKQSTTRQRPYRSNVAILKLVNPQDEYSFPSGHTAAATVSALLFSTELPALAPLFFTAASLIGISRIYLGVHYPSDVVMGFVLGAVSFVLSTVMIG
ncbi:MAG: phosphatase PAP2 family protein [Bacteroidota bacterium]